MSGKSYFSESTPVVVIQSLFRKYDADGNGELQREEIMSLLRVDLGLETKKAEAILAAIDKDSDGSVSFEEFLQWFRNEEGMEMVNESQDCCNRYYYTRKAVDLFKKYDIDGNGNIDAVELKKLLDDIDYKHSVQDALTTMDKDGDGTVSFPEFLKWLNWIPTSDTEWEMNYVGESRISYELF